MRSIRETMDFLQDVSQAVDLRLADLKQTGADNRRLERERWRRQMIQETIKAVEEARLAAS